MQDCCILRCRSLAFKIEIPHFANIKYLYKYLELREESLSEHALSLILLFFAKKVFLIKCTVTTVLRSPDDVEILSLTVQNFICA